VRETCNAFTCYFALQQACCVADELEPRRQAPGYTCLLQRLPARSGAPAQFTHTSSMTLMTLATCQCGPLAYCCAHEHVMERHGGEGAAEGGGEGRGDAGTGRTIVCAWTAASSTRAMLIAQRGARHTTNSLYSRAALVNPAYSTSAKWRTDKRQQQQRAAPAAPAAARIGCVRSRLGWTARLPPHAARHGKGDLSERRRRGL
jgi:hypothetical protein